MQNTNGNSIAVDDLLTHKSRTIVSSEKTSRISAMDIQRGIIMVIMALSHCGEYVSVDHYNNLTWKTSPAWQDASIFNLIQETLVAAVAGGFFMMMGISIVLLYQSRLKDGWSQIKTCNYLIKRGLLLIVLQMTVLEAFECVAESKFYLYVGVLFGLGGCMILAAIMLYITHQLQQLRPFQKYPLQYIIPMAVIILITTAIHLLINHLHQTGDLPSILETIFFVSGHFDWWGTDVSINFTPIPWFPAVAVGMMLGQIIHDRKADSFRLMGIIGITFLVAFIGIRYANISDMMSVGDYKVLDPNESLNFASYFSITKYPPSITYYLWALGFNLFCMFLIFKAQASHLKFVNFLSPLEVFGQCALFFFVVHWFVYYGMSLLIGTRLESIPQNMLAWLIGLFILYPLCKSFRNFKFTKPKDSIWRMF